MARSLIIGCGCRGLMLARSLSDRGHSVRGTTRDPGRLGELGTAGVDAVLGDPDRVATLVPALDHVTVACILLGSASGSGDRLQALHGPRLEMLLSKMVDTTIKGVVYEAGGTVDKELLRAGAARVRAFARDSHAALQLLDADPADPGSWLEAAVGAVDQVLAAD